MSVLASHDAVEFYLHSLLVLGNCSSKDMDKIAFNRYTLEISTEHCACPFNWRCFLLMIPCRELPGFWPKWDDGRRAHSFSMYNSPHSWTRRGHCLHDRLVQAKDKQDPGIPPDNLRERPTKTPCIDRVVGHCPKIYASTACRAPLSDSITAQA